jgi:hypothetical protein
LATEFVVYRLDFASGKAYIGATKNLVQRLRSHKSQKQQVGRAWRRFGAPKVSILAKTTEDKIYSLEQKLVDQQGTLAPNGYNMKRGGTRDFTFSEETRKRMSKAKIGTKASASTVKKMRISQKKRGKRSAETKRRMSAAAKRRGMPRWIILAGAKANKGKHQSMSRRKMTSELITLWWKQRKAA